MRYLSLHEYDGVLLATLRSMGSDDDFARRMIAGRWPMNAACVLAEVDNRGFCADLVDVAAFLAEIGAPGTISNSFFDSSMVEAFLQWLVSSGRAKLSHVGRMHQRADSKKVIKGICQAAASETN